MKESKATRFYIKAAILIGANINEPVDVQPRKNIQLLHQPSQLTMPLNAKPRKTAVALGEADTHAKRVEFAAWKWALLRHMYQFQHGQSLEIPYTESEGLKFLPWNVFKWRFVPVLAIGTKEAKCRTRTTSSLWAC